MPTLSPEQAARFARLALDCVDREFPNHLLHLMNGPADVGTPRQLTPVFFGCFDWHSAVHSHWTLVRLIRLFPDADWTGTAREVLRRHFTSEGVAGEVAYLSAPGRGGFERPYGLAWLLQLCAECREWPDVDADRWADTLAPLERLAVERFSSWLPKLTRPVRSGEHSQTAFALGLMWDWAHVADDGPVIEVLTERIHALYGSDRDAPWRFEPSGHDFLSPALAEADLLRRVLPPDEFAAWLAGFLPDLSAVGRASGLTELGGVKGPSYGLFQPVTTRDRADGKLAHWDGLNLSRAWMLRGIAAALPAEDPRIAGLLRSADAHEAAGLPAVTGEHYAGGHWLGSFAVYLTTDRGIVSAGRLAPGAEDFDSRSEASP